MKRGRKGLSQAEQDRVWAVRQGGRSDSEVARRLGLEPPARDAVSGGLWGHPAAASHAFGAVFDACGA